MLTDMLIISNSLSFVFRLILLLVIFPGTCSWLKPAVNLTCSRVSSDDLLEFTLSLQDVCLNMYRLVMKKDSHIILNTLITKKKRVHLVLKNTDNISIGSLNDSYFVLEIDKTSDVNNVKVKTVNWKVASD